VLPYLPNYGGQLMADVTSRRSFEKGFNYH